jgi:CHAT domain
MDALRERLELYAFRPDHELVLGSAAIADAVEALASAADLLGDAQVMAAVGLLHFLRFEAGREDWDELQIACMFCTPLLDRRAELIPGLVRAFLTRERKRGRPRRDNPAQAAMIMALTAKPPATAAGAGAGAELLWQLSLVLHDRYEQTGEDATLREALAVLRHAAAAIPAGDPLRARRLSSLGAMLQERSRNVHDPSLLEEAVLAQRQAAGDGTHPDHAALLFNLGSSLHSRYLQTGQVADLMGALDADRQAIAETPPDHPAYPRRLANLGICLLSWFGETGLSGDLDQALDSLRAALAGTGDERIRQEFILPALASALHARYEISGDLDALDAAIAMHQEAAAGWRPEDAHHRQQTVNLAGVLLLQYRRTGAVPSLEQAISLLHGARQEIQSADSPAVLVALHDSLCMALRERYELTGNLADLDDAITQGRRAVSEAVTPAARRGTRTGLGLALVRRYLWSRDRGPFAPDGTAFLEEALEELREAVAAASSDDPGLTVTLSILGETLLVAKDADATLATTAEATEVLGLAADSRLAQPRIRAEAGIAAGRLAAGRQDWDLAVRRLAAAIGLLEQAVPRGLSRGDREHQLKRLRDLAADAAAVAWRAGDAEHAAVLLEQGRGVLLAQAMDVPRDLAVLGARRPDLKARFDHLRGAIDGSQSGEVPSMAAAADRAALTAAERRGHLIGEWEQLVSQIRDLPGLGRFLMPPQIADLLAAASDGPIALVNTSGYGSAAFVLQPGGVTPVPLPDLSPATARAMVAELLTVVDLEERKDKERRLLELLGWLWDVVTGPVIEQLGRMGPAAPTRIWWCPSGLLSFLPLHAAGHHRARAGVAAPTVMDRMISSYTPTVRMLMHGRRAAASADADEVDRTAPMLIVVPAPGDLPGAAKEAAILSRLTETEVIEGEAATRDVVMSALARYRRVHFAGHAVSNIDDPSAGYLELADRGVRPLNVADVLSLHLDHAELAYLSACSTYQGGSALADEAIHLGSAFQLAGYRHVIATLWPTLDSPPARRIAESVHRDTAGTVGLAGTASALHRAVRRQRDRAPDAPSIWAAYMHGGV